MPSPPSDVRPLDLKLDAALLAMEPDWLAEVRCLECRGEVDFHQPQIQAPERILGICHDCHRWFLINALPERSEAVIVLLPACEDFREALARALEEPGDHGPVGPA